MLLDIARAQAGTGYDFTPARSEPVPRPQWTVIIPFFNEREFLPATLASLGLQGPALLVMLVDNGSTDGSRKLAEAECRRLGLACQSVIETRPGKVAALKAGLGHVRTSFVATCDADTVYPANYLAEAERLLRIEGTAAVGAFYAHPLATRRERRKKALHINIMGRLLFWQCHTGGAGQAFRTDRLRAAGGFDPAIWNWVLEDHEIMHRVSKTGAIRYGFNLWCSPSPRERDRESIRWTLLERILYHVAPARWQGDFFYKILGPRLQGRKLSSERIREQPHRTIGDMIDASSDLVCG
jgi:glycosyltransferase involved in cell wall biosynthesis